MAGTGPQVWCIEAGCRNKLVKGTKRCAKCGAYHRGRMMAKKLGLRTYSHPTADAVGAADETNGRAAIHLARSAPLTAYFRGV